MNKIIIQKGYEGREKIPFVLDSEFHILYLSETNPTNKAIPHIGSVEFCEQAIGQKKPDFYPEWTKPIWHREITFNSWINCRTFVKGIHHYKEGSHTVHPIMGQACLPLYQEYAVSKLVNFVDEYRHYYINGKEICSWWYDGIDESHSYKYPNGQEIKNINIPKDFCGTIDMGVLDSEEYALVEVHNHPYAIGWYGEDMDEYKKFILEGWYRNLA